MLKLYSLAIKNNNIGALFLIPFLNDNLYCFNLFLITKKEFDLNSIINIKYDLIKINSITQYYEDTITLEILEKIYDFSTLQFKDYIVPIEELKKTRPYDIFSLPEKIEYDNFLKFMIEHIDDNFQNNGELNKKEIILREKL